MEEAFWFDVIPEVEFCGVGSYKTQNLCAQTSVLMHFPNGFVYSFFCSLFSFSPSLSLLLSSPFFGEVSCSLAVFQLLI